MKNRAKIIAFPLFTIAYASFFSLGVECFFGLLGTTLAASLDHKPAIERYPRFISFCVIVGFICLLALFLIALFNVKLSEKLNYKKSDWIIQFVLTFVISIPMIKIWEMAFIFLRRAF